MNTSFPLGCSLGTRSSQSTTKSVPPKGRPQFSCGLPSSLECRLPCYQGMRRFFLRKQNRQQKNKGEAVLLNEDLLIRNTLVNYWKEVIRKEQIKEDTLSMNPEFCMYLDEIFSGKPLSEYQLETYKEITNKPSLA